MSGFPIDRLADDGMVPFRSAQPGHVRCINCDAVVKVPDDVSTITQSRWEKTQRFAFEQDGRPVVEHVCRLHDIDDVRREFGVDAD